MQQAFGRSMRTLLCDPMFAWTYLCPRHVATARGDVPADAMVEAPAVVDSKGIHPLRVGALPQRVMLGAVLPQWLAMERRLAGFRTGDPRYLLQVLLSEHRTRDWEHAVDTLDAIVAMPGNEAMAQYFDRTTLGALNNVQPKVSPAA